MHKRFQICTVLLLLLLLLLLLFLFITCVKVLYTCFTLYIVYFGCIYFFITLLAFYGQRKKNFIAELRTCFFTVHMTINTLKWVKLLHVCRSPAVWGFFHCYKVCFCFLTLIEGQRTVDVVHSPDCKAHWGFGLVFKLFSPKWSYASSLSTFYSQVINQFALLQAFSSCTCGIFCRFTPERHKIKCSHSKWVDHVSSHPYLSLALHQLGSDISRMVYSSSFLSSRSWGVIGV